MNEFGIASWLYNRQILHDKTMTMLELPAATKAAGASVLELCSVFFTGQDAAYLNQVRQGAADAGVSLRNIAVDRIDISVPDDAERRTNLETAKQWFHVAKAIGCASVRVNSGGSADTSEEELARIVASYRELAVEAEQTGVYLLIENHGGASYNPANIQRFLSEVNSPWFRTCPDTGNFPDGTWEEGIRVMAPHAYSVHVKLFSYDEDGNQPQTGRDGHDRSVNLVSMLRTLRDAGYEGPYCIESGIEEDQTDSARKAISYVQGLLGAL
jgi:sugar phosphate isomerase/epimerase